ncbi:Uncharacterized protein ChrSV_5070 [Chromobacterium vaccinii]|nr:Uncharacterized protein ChrSW_5064 [Chromobacterium vaccinii]QND92525.1 Uncharacterized protein ChrSV_5070 [Chromobacterium vaccinii]
MILALKISITGQFEYLPLRLREASKFHAGLSRELACQ